MWRQRDVVWIAIILLNYHSNLDSSSRLAPRFSTSVTAQAIRDVAHSNRRRQEDVLLQAENATVVNYSVSTNANTSNIVKITEKQVTPGPTAASTAAISTRTSRPVAASISDTSLIAHTAFFKKYLASDDTDSVSGGNATTGSSSSSDNTKTLSNAFVLPYMICAAVAGIGIIGFCVLYCLCTCCCRCCCCDVERGAYWREGTKSRLKGYGVSNASIATGASDETQENETPPAFLVTNSRRNSRATSFAADDAEVQDITVQDASKSGGVVPVYVPSDADPDDPNPLDDVPPLPRNPSNLSAFSSNGNDQSQDNLQRRESKLSDKLQSNRSSMFMSAMSMGLGDEAADVDQTS